MNLPVELILIACVTGIACVLPGTFLILRGTALMCDAISHSVLPGIVIFYLLVHNLESAWLFVGALVAGVLTVVLTEWIIVTKQIKLEAAIGLVFPLFFSIGVLLINFYARNTHLDIDMVLLGELGFAPLNRLIINGTDCGPVALFIMLGILIINTLFTISCYKELKISTFDPVLARLMSFSPQILHFLLMIITSITIVSGLNIVGSVIIITLFIVPSATACLLSSTLSHILVLAHFTTILACTYGYGVALLFDTSIAGSIALCQGILFLCALLFAPQKGLLAQLFYNKKKRKELYTSIVHAYLKQYPYCTDSRVIMTALGWKGTMKKKSIDKAIDSFDHYLQFDRVK